MEKDCIFIGKDRKGKAICTACKKFYCESEDCSFCKTKEDLEIEEYAKKVKKEAKRTNYRYCNADCIFWSSKYSTCKALKAPFCAVEDCSFYRNVEDPNKAIRWVEVKKTGPNGWAEVGDRHTRFKMDR